MIEVLYGDIYRWDTGRVVRCKADDIEHRIDEIHAYNGTTTNAIVLNTYEIDDWVYASIPAVVLQKNAKLFIYLVMKVPEGEITFEHEEIEVIDRKKPDDYIYEPEELLQYAKLDAEIKALAEKIENVESPKGFVKTINNQAPDEDGNVELDLAVGVDEKIREALQEAKDSGEFDGKDGYTPVKGVDYFDGAPGQPGEKGDPGEPGSDASVTAESIENALGYKPVNAEDVDDDVFVVRVEGDVADKTYDEIRQAISDKKVVYLRYGEFSYELFSFATDIAIFAKINDLDTDKIGCRKIQLYFGEEKLHVTRTDIVVSDEVDNEFKELGTRPVANGVVTAKFIEVDKQINDLQAKVVAPIAAERVVKTEQVFEENLVFEDSQAFSSSACPIETGNYYQLVIKKLDVGEETVIIDQILEAVHYEMDGIDVGVAIVFDNIGIVSFKNEFAADYGVSTLVTINENNAGITDGELVVSVSRTVNVISQIEARLDNIVEEVIAALPTAEGVSF